MKAEKHASGATLVEVTSWYLLHFSLERHMSHMKLTNKRSAKRENVFIVKKEERTNREKQEAAV